VHTAENESDTLSGTAVLFGRDDIQSVVTNYPRLESQFSALIA
jgi:hypothetical protein